MLDVDQECFATSQAIETVEKEVERLLADDAKADKFDYGP